MESTYVRTLINKYRRKGVLVDANLMLLVVVGMYDISRIQQFKRTQKYDASIYQTIIGLLSQFERRFTTPNIFTEIDNLARQAREAEWAALSWAMNSLASRHASRSRAEPRRLSCRS